MEKKEITTSIAGHGSQQLVHNTLSSLMETFAQEETLVQNFRDHNEVVRSIAKLSQRELDFITRACSEKSYQEIAKEMFVSKRTVDGYREVLFRKLDVSTRVGLVMYAIKNKLVML